MSFIARSSCCLWKSLQWVGTNLSQAAKQSSACGTTQLLWTQQRQLTCGMKSFNVQHLNISETLEKCNVLDCAKTGIKYTPIFKPNVMQVRTYKEKVALRLRCKCCYFVRREGRLFVECTKYGRHKQMQFMPKWKKDIMSEKTKGNWRHAVFTGHKKDRFYRIGKNKYSDATQTNWLEGKLGVTV